VTDAATSTSGLQAGIPNFAFGYAAQVNLD
jgi:hypothetical protein